MEKYEKVVVITGASAGIGADLLNIFHEKGYRVVGLARRKDRMQKQCDRLNASHVQTALAVECDVSKEESVTAAFSSVVATFGRIDGVIANAGFGVSGPVETLNVSDYRRQFDTNVFGVLSCFFSAKNELKKYRGFFAVVGSVNSYLSLPTTSAYCMSKFSVRAFTESLYWEMLPHGVGVTLICPGFVKTEIRLVDNGGAYQESAKDPVPEWIMQSSRHAAEKTAAACIRRKKEVVLSGHGKLAVFLARHIPGALGFFKRSMASGAARTRAQSMGAK